LLPLLQKQKVKVEIPKFKVESSNDLKVALTEVRFLFHSLISHDNKFIYFKILKQTFYNSLVSAISSTKAKRISPVSRITRK
jgi:serine protease inhibitor